jgi:poly(hydroxyalkanoate) granule-associated protein
MVSKLRELAKPDENAMLEAVCGSAHQIWQAGLGAFAKAQQEGGDMFDKLVQDGLELQKLTQRLTSDKSFSVTDTVTRLAENASRQASGSWDKLEKIFEERVSRSLRSLGMPSQEEINALSRDMAELKTALRTVGERSEEDIHGLNRAIADLKAAIGSVEKKPVMKKAAVARPAVAKPAAAKRAVAKPAAKAAVKAPVKAAAKRPALKRPAAKKQARSAPSAG